jgi:hypothetical protein
MLQLVNNLILLKVNIPFLYNLYLGEIFCLSIITLVDPLDMYLEIINEN